MAKPNSRSADDLSRTLRLLDGRSYKSYLDIKGEWRFPGFLLSVDHVQGDPFATPSRFRARIGAAEAELPGELLTSPSRILGVAALLARSFALGARRESKSRGSGRSGVIQMEAPGQEVLAQTAVIVTPEGDVEARFGVGLPADGRRILSAEAIKLVVYEVPSLVRSTLRAVAHDPETLERHALVNEDAEALREALAPLGLVAFVADGASLPRRSGIDDRPLRSGVVPFQSPDSLRVRVELPNAGSITGMGIPAGVTLIVGGGFHGKSTVLRALERGVYNHRPDDGRERAVSDPATVKVRAEDGRSVAGVDISGFINNLPLARDTASFSTPNASGSTSQAAVIVEALEAGARVLLIDEDTSATNFMIRDRRMQALVPKEGEPITPFIDRVRALYDQRGVSSVLVLGGSGDYLDVADTVIAMKEYVPADVTAEARAVSKAWPTGRVAEVGEELPETQPRLPLARSVNPRRGRRPSSVRVRDTYQIEFGESTIDLSAVDQIVSRAQTRAIGNALALARRRWIDDRNPVTAVLDEVMRAVERDGLDVLDERKSGELAAFRRFELAAALNRLRSLRVSHVGQAP